FEEETTFSQKDLNEGCGSQDDPIVIKLDIANFTVHKVLVDNGSSTDIIFREVLKKMVLEDANLSPVKTPLVDFGGSEVNSLRTSDLLVSMGEEPRRRNTMIKFLVVDTPCSYNVILERSGLNLFRAVVSTYHQKMKFPTKNWIGEVLCDQKEAWKCYNLSMRKGEQEERGKRKERDEVEEADDLKRFKPERIEPAEQHKSVELVSGESDKITRIGSNMNEAFDTMMIEFLRKNVDMFAWSPSDFKGIDPEVQYTKWLANIVVVPNASGKWRMCTDFTDLNKVCPKDPYLLPRINFSVDSTAGCELFNMMDAYQGATYQRLVNRMFWDQIGVSMEVHVDDMLVKSKKEDDHLYDLKQAFEVMRTYGMKLNPTKCTFGV
ncbi:UNVERIFIED_CONTAM: hypothetical protein Slati_3976200, partial [Sesamum latifolium]